MIVDGFLDWAERVDGPAHKQYPNPNQGIGIACHSVVANLPGHAIPSRFFDPVDQASVMFMLYKDGHVIQMYPVTSSTWTSGSFAANTMYWAIEAEGGGAPNYGEKLTDAAAFSFIRIVTEWEAYSGRKALPGENILQHKDLVAKYGGGATACASDRYSEAWARVAAGERYRGDEMSAEDKARLDRLEKLLAGNGIAKDLSKPAELTFGEEALAYAAERGWSAFLGLGLNQTKVGEHIANHPGATTVAPHTHVPGEVQ
jgi:hypothetical protein